MKSYVEVAVADASYHGETPLTYEASFPLAVGNIVKVPLRTTQVLALVLSNVRQPNFKVKQVIELVIPEVIPPQLIELLTWMREHYASPLGVTAQQFLPSSIVDPEPGNSSQDFTLKNLPPLTQDQEKAIRLISGPGMYLLHGDTGTGKTRVYTELAYRVLQEKKSAIILTPEIGLTPQLAKDFRQIFKDRVFVLHSQLKETVRRKIWASLLAEKSPVVVVGPRSALFAPLHNVGLIIIDEAHETAYKQDQTPYYHATRVASKLADLHKATVVLGSATPLVVDYYLADQKHRPIIHMTQNAITSNIPKRYLKVIDLKDRNNLGRSSYLSIPLVKAMEEKLARNEQILLFLNRRGTARVVLCTRCGWQALCPHCDLSLIYHGDMHVMRCHSCSHTEAPPNSCPKCQNSEIVLKSVGTKAITDEVSVLFPEARVMRFDNDNKKDERIEHHYDAIRSGEVDIIVGTQILAKGLDLPKLGLVGVIIADTSLYFPDFTAQERTYQLLYQVIGRIGRGHRESEAIIQTYLPDNAVINEVISNGWEKFYKNELAERDRFLFPPFCHLLKLTCKRSTSKSAQLAAQRLTDKLRTSNLRIIVEGPSPSFHERVNDKHCWQLIVKAKDRNELLRSIKLLPSGWSYDVDPMNLL